MPIAAQRLLGGVRWFVFFLIIERVGTEALAIANIVFTCYIVFRIPTEGFSETACSMVMLCLTWFLAIYLAWPMSLVWLAVPIAWLVSLAVSYGWIKSGIWKRLAF